MFGSNFVICIVLLCSFVRFICPKQQLACDYNELFTTIYQCHRYDVLDATKVPFTPDKCKIFDIDNQYEAPPLFVLYDVNAVEGFNLRRDVYIRLAVFMANLRQNNAQYRNTYLVVPPFYRLYHWNFGSHHSENSNQVVFWNHFFELNSIRQYTAVLDMWQYFTLMRDCFSASETATIHINHVYKLRHFKSMFESGKFVERFEVKENECDGNRWYGQFLDFYRNFTVDHVHCVEFQGTASLLKDLLHKYPNRSKRKPQTVAILNAESVLHDYWGGVEYWRARRSMRFNEQLVTIANAYRKQTLNSTDSVDYTQQPSDWQDETEHRSAIGGDYLCAHLRRRDFLSGRDATTPTLRSAAMQISTKLKELGLRTVFISSDCTGQEFHDLRSYLMRYRVTKFKSSMTKEHKKLLPGAVAVIDQIICSKARYFIGTYESTFTYRIYEEREILSFKQETTFNTFCKEPDNTVNCTRNAVWPIVFGF